MLVQLANAMGHPLNKKYAMKFGLSVVKGSLTYMTGSRIGTSLLALTGLGAPAAMGANAILNFGYTWLLGGFLIQQFSNPDLDLRGLAPTATSFLLSFAFDDVLALVQGHDAIDMVADVPQTISGAADVHLTASTATEVHSGFHAASDGLRFSGENSLPVMVSAAPVDINQLPELLPSIIARGEQAGMSADVLQSLRDVNPAETETLQRVWVAAMQKEPGLLALDIRFGGKG
jgi:hypothetical protein